METKSSLFSGVTWERVSGRLSISVSKVVRTLSNNPLREGLIISAFLLIVSVFIYLHKDTKYYHLLQVITNPTFKR